MLEFRMSDFPYLAPLYALISAFLFALSNHFSNMGLTGSDPRTGTIVSIAASAVIYWIFAPFFVKQWYWPGRRKGLPRCWRRSPAPVMWCSRPH